MRRSGFVLAAGLALALGSGWWLATDFAPSPARYIAGGIPAASESRVSAYSEVGCRTGRTCLDVALALSDGSELRAAVSLPDPLPSEPLPALLVFGGFETGRRALGLLPDPGPNAVVTYEYPLDRDAWRDAGLPRRFLMVQRTAHRVPRQLAALMRWLRTRPWSDEDRLSYAGISLGALLLPAALHLARAGGEPAGHNVLAYGGADARAIVAANLKSDLGLEPAWLRETLAAAVALTTRAVEPAAHLPHIEGPLLIVGASEDRLIPAEAVAAQRRVAPPQAQFLTLDGGHIHPNAADLLSRLLAVVGDWLLEGGAVEAIRDPQKS